MSARRIETARIFSQPTAPTRLTLSANAVRIRKNGIEFRAAHPILDWTEMTVELESSRDSRKIRCTGVVVACNGSPDEGYVISLLFTGLSPESQALLSTLAFPPRA